jgi:uncharacterized membrane protein YhaH (DUF805 family)
LLSLLAAFLNQHRMLTRSASLLIAVATIVIAASVLLARRHDASRSVIAARQPDSVWYHESDVAQLARTGRPQLVEFFHPG